MNFHMLLKESIEDEREGIARYEKLAAMAPSEYAPILHDIGKEEKQHLHFLSEIAAETGYMDDEDETETPSQNGNSGIPAPMHNDQLKHLQDDMAEIKSLLVEVLAELKRNDHTGENNDSPANSPDVEVPKTEQKTDTEPQQPLPDEIEAPAENGVSPRAVPTGIIR